MRRPRLSAKTGGLAFSVCAIVFLAATSLQAQRSSSLNYESARRLGLTPAWSKAIPNGYGGKISGVEIHVSPEASYKGTEVVDRYGRRTFFSDRDVRGRRPSRSSYDQTLRLTDLKKAQLSALGLEPQVEVKQIPDVTIYIRSTTGTVTALDAETGQQKWSVQAGTPGYPSYGMSANDDHVVTLSSATLYLLDAKHGQVLDNVSTQFLPSGTPTLDRDLIYVPTTKGVIRVLQTDDLTRQAFTLGSSGRIQGSVTVSPTTASWLTSDGYIYVANAGAPGILYRFQSLDTMVAAPVYMDATLFASSLDGYVYAIDESTGEVKWRYAAGGSIREAPLAIEDCVYVTTEDGQMSALDAKSGETKWLASQVERFVSVSDTRVFCITAGQALTALDRSTGARMGSVPIGDLGLPVVNTRTDRVYLIGKQGVIHCYRELENRWPIARAPEVRQDAEAAAAPQEATAEPTAAAEEDAPATPDSPSASDAEDLFGDVNDDQAAEPADEPADEVDPDPFGDLGEGAGDENPFEDF